MIVTNGFFKKLLKHFKNTNINGVSPKIMYTKKPKKFGGWVQQLEIVSNFKHK